MGGHLENRERWVWMVRPSPVVEAKHKAGVVPDVRAEKSKTRAVLGPDLYLDWDLVKPGVTLSCSSCSDG